MYLQYQLHHLCVNQTVNRLSINLGDQVPLPQTCILGRTAILHMLRANRYRWSDGRWGGKKGQEPKDGEKQKDGRNGNVFWAYGRFFRCLLPSSVNNKNPNTLHPHSVYSIPDSRSPHINTSSTCRFVLNVLKMFFSPRPCDVQCRCQSLPCTLGWLSG